MSDLDDVEAGKIIATAIGKARDDELSTMAQNAAASAVLRKKWPQLSADNALAMVFRWRKGVRPTARKAGKG
jgi:hypothetical protein